jgi:hypothetical protein
MTNGVAGLLFRCGHIDIPRLWIPFHTKWRKIRLSLLEMEGRG